MFYTNLYFFMKGMILNEKGIFKKQRNMAIAVLAVLVMSMFGTVAFASGTGSAAKIGTYCTISGAFVKLNKSQIYGNAYIINKTGGKAYMTINLKQYDATGALYDTDSYSGVISSGGKLSTESIATLNVYTIKSTGSVYKGTSSSSGQLETLTITIN